MKYLMFVCTDPEPGPADELADVEAWVDDLESRGARLLGDRLRPAAEAKVVRVRDGVRRVTDGPFSETNEWIVGFDVLECGSLDEAVEIAGAHPMAATGRIEVRAFWPFQDD